MFWDVAIALLVACLMILVASACLFVGIAAPDPLDAYLTGVEYSTFRDTPKQLEYAVHGGTAPASTPGQQHFWIAQATGTGTQTVLAPAQGHWTLVVMSADASRSPSVQVYLDASLPGLDWIAAGLVLLGAICLAGGAMLLIIPIGKARGSRRPTTSD